MENFDIIFEDKTANVEVHSISGQTIYRVTFADTTPQLILTRANHFNANRFWTSIPGGRQELAEKIGIAVQEYFKNKK